MRDEGCKCQGCQKIYTCDLIIPDDVWEKIKPSGKPAGAGLLCPTCIIEKLQTFQSVWYLFGKHKTTPDRTKAYAVIGHSWDDPYDAGYEWVEGVFELKKDAESFKVEAGKNIPRYDEYVKKLTNKIRDSVYNHVCRDYVLEYDSDAFWDEVQRIQDALLLKVYEKYPNLTGDKWEENVRFEVKEVDYYKVDQQ